ncbi:chemotaxis protein CheB [Cupriavidus sp. WKF15]|uniref:chemotaxis protein CheB n=1 Tax=Cupriavidus sp. WKF15 TaxID=3032282 RepID=UPI0023E31F53|nr:chemotaxis protein CheB [Cupriavidus sp. WKF15]WER46629.1 chemotaxis protein CheB [Cupriavidus sp. WKF15]
MTRNIVVIGGSRGAFAVLRDLVAALPADLDAAVFIVLHVGKHQSQLPSLLARWGKLPASYPRHGETWHAGHIYVAPPDYHMLVTAKEIELSHGAQENHSRPAIDPLFRSAAVAFGPRVIGVILSGDLDDGAAGLAFVRAFGGRTLIQHPCNAEASSMPRAAMEAAGADAVAEPREIGEAIAGLLHAGGGQHQWEKDMDALRTEAATAGSPEGGVEDLDRIAMRAAITCPECGGAMWQLRDTHPLRFRCHTGHAFSGMTLAAAEDKAAEHALFAAMRTQKESLALARIRASQAKADGDHDAYQFEQSRIRQTERLLKILHDAICG